MADNTNQLNSTQGHETEKIDVQGCKALLQKFKNDILDAGLDYVLARVETLVSNLSTTVETNRIKILGSVESLSPTATYAQNSLITVAKETFISTASIVGTPNHIVTYNSENVTYNGEIVTFGSNSLSTWVKIAG